MSLRIYDTATRRVRDFVPVVPGRVGVYCCGATVQSSPHIGHLRSAIVFDQLVRWLRYSGLDVTLIRNVTDIDDKILVNAERAGRPWWAHAYLYEHEFTAAYAALGVLPPTFEPHATAHVPDMVELIGRLVEAGHAYPATDDSGDVYFDSASWPTYGSLTHQRPDDMTPDGSAPERARRSPHDWALWKGRKDGEPETASWNTPWGRGRPGWHLECTAMSVRYLGGHFDIHGGGLDLRFPHHENELAQARAAGHDFANYWMHNGLVNISGQKMSKSLGNTLSPQALLADARPLAVRYYLGSAQYRSTLEYGPDSLAEAEAAVGRIEAFVHRAQAFLGADAPRSADDVVTAAGGRVVPEPFAAAMDDDLAVPAALAVLHETVRTGNALLEQGRIDEAGVREALGAVLAMTGVLGIDPTAEPWVSESAAGRGSDALARLVDSELAARVEARRARDFDTADAIRDRLASAGIAVEDGPRGTTWSLEK